jgi:hypothetical protein
MNDLQKCLPSKYKIDFDVHPPFNCLIPQAIKGRVHIKIRIQQEHIWTLHQSKIEKDLVLIFKCLFDIQTDLTVIKFPINLRETIKK